MRLLSALLLAALLAPQGAAQQVDVFFAPRNSVVEVGDVLEVDLIATEVVGRGHRVLLVRRSPAEPPTRSFDSSGCGAQRPEAALDRDNNGRIDHRDVRRFERENGLPTRLSDAIRRQTPASRR